MADEPLTFEDIYRNLSGTAALLAAGQTDMRKRKGEYDTEFVKRIVAAYLVNAQAIDAHG